jgi:DNA-directed RNA polymerase specialized sigma24 family protein
MDSDVSVTRLIGMLKAGDRAAAEQLWETYFRRLVGLARARLQSTARRVADEEDVALSAFASFYRRAERGGFPRLQDRDDLWQLLFVLTVRKAINLVHYQGRLSRGAGRVESVVDLAGIELESAIGREPTPEFAAEMTDECRRLLDCLGDQTLRSVALWKMEGLTNSEVAARLGCVEKSVERKLRVIRQIWSGEASP